MTNPVHADALRAHRSFLGGQEGWVWRKPRKPAHFRTCSYCGCINPEDLVAEPAWTAEWSDQKYGWPHKFYVAIPDRHGELDILGSSTTDTPPGGGRWKRVSDLTDAERAVCDSYHLAHPTMWLLVGTRDTHHGKFYTEHLADPTVTQEVKDAIQLRSGLVFTFHPDGRVAWRPAE